MRLSVLGNDGRRMKGHARGVSNPGDEQGEGRGEEEEEEEEEEEKDKWQGVTFWALMMYWREAGNGERKNYTSP